jgi:pimeloyl-ACP methyl ester carboxylesterase
MHFIPALALAIVANSGTRSADSLALRACQIPNVVGDVRCGTLTVPEDRQRPNGRTIDLYIVVLAPTGPSPSADAIVWLPGGPGGGVARDAPGLAFTYSALRARHTIILMDPRGTGASGALLCDLDDAAADDYGTYFREFMPAARVRACRERLERSHDLTRYTTEAIADDIESLRRALNVPRLNLVGTSGGTRQAQVYQRRYPDNVRSMVLAGVVSHGFRMPISYARDAQRAFDILVRDCAADDRCSRAFPDPAGDLRTVLAQLERAPVRVAITRPGRSADTAVVTRDIFAETLRAQMYSMVGASRIPMVLRRGAAGDFLPFANFVLPNRRPPPNPEGVAVGHFLTLTCADDLARIRDHEIASATANSFLRDYRVRQQIDACKLWPKATLSREYFEAPKVSRVPVLFISGEADPVTPPRWAEEAATYLPNSASLVFAHGGHVPINTMCGVMTIAAFLERGSPDGLDVSCGKNFRRPPFVLEP